MTDRKNPTTPEVRTASPPSTEIPSKTNNGNGKGLNGKANHSGQKARFSNPPDPTNPDPSTLREQWRFAVRQYSRWYAHAWGTAILAGLSFFALGWIIKGSNPLPSSKTKDSSSGSSPSASSSNDADKVPR